MTVESTIDYEGLAQEAMRGVVRKVLARTAKSGLVGDHHFYISFDTEAPGVTLSKRLKEKYPHEMTIVLQHRFWDLAVTEDRFEVKLTFDGIPERLVVPFDAIKVFFDPSVRFGLQFEDPGAAEARTQPAGGPESLGARGGTRAGPRKQARSVRKSSAQEPGDQRSAANGAAPPAETQDTEPPAPAALTPKPGGKRPAADDAAAGAEEGEQPRPGAEIVSLDKFRKK